MKKLLFPVLLLVGTTQPMFAQDSLTGSVSASAVGNTSTIISMQNTTAESNGKYPSPYKTSWKVDAPLIVGGVGLTALGTYLISKKSDLTQTQLASRTPDKVPFFDRHSAGFYSKRADDLSYIPFKASFVMPIVVGLVNKNERQNLAQVLVLYTETMAITGTLFTMAAGNIHRSRPYVYGNIADDELRKDRNSQRSFFAGHTAATAAATFFTAKVFSDFNPNSKARVYVWVAAAAVPALVGYWRYKAGMHFLSDNLLGYSIGAATGILVPHFHKKWKVKNLSMTPQFGGGYQGLALTYKIK